MRPLTLVLALLAFLMPAVTMTWSAHAGTSPPPKSAPPPK